MAYFVSTKGALYLTLLLEKNPKDMTIIEVSLSGIFKGVYVGRREGEANWMEKTLLICNICWPENLKEVSPCFGKSLRITSECT